MIIFMYAWMTLLQSSLPAVGPLINGLLTAQSIPAALIIVRLTPSKGLHQTIQDFDCNFELCLKPLERRNQNSRVQRHPPAAPCCADQASSSNLNIDPLASNASNQ
jgi:hypothetical protein